MKKAFSTVLFLILCFILIIPVQAAYQNPSVIDQAGYLSDTELKQLSEELDRVREAYECDVAIYTEYQMSGVDAESSADDIFDYQGYGYGSQSDGIILYICEESREYHFSAHGYGMTAFNDNGLDYLENQVVPYLEADDYYGAFQSYAQYAEDLLEMARNGEPFDQKQHSMEFILLVIGAGIAVPLLVALVKMKKKLKMMKTAVQEDYAVHYMKSGSKAMTLSRDMFLYSTVAKTEKAKSSSGTHTSSSGRTHGGSGGKF